MNFGSDADLMQAFAENPHAFRPDETIGDMSGMLSYVVGEKDKTIPVFYWRPIIDRPASNEAKRPIYVRQAWIKMFQPGEQLHVVDRQVEAVHQNRFPAAWERFEKRSNSTPDGIPIDALFPWHPETVLTMRAANIPTVESLASLSDSALQQLGMGMGELRDRARHYLLSIQDPQGVESVLQAERMAALEVQNAALVKTLDEQKKAYAAMEERVAALAQGASEASSKGKK